MALNRLATTTLVPVAGDMLTAVTLGYHDVDTNCPTRCSGPVMGRPARGGAGAARLRRIRSGQHNSYDTIPHTCTRKRHQCLTPYHCIMVQHMRRRRPQAAGASAGGPRAGSQTGAREHRLLMTVMTMLFKMMYAGQGPAAGQQTNQSTHNHDTGQTYPYVSFSKPPPGLKDAGGP